MLYIVLNSQFAPVSSNMPAFHKAYPEYATFTKVYFDEKDKTAAEKFAEFMAETMQQRFYLTKVEKYVQPTKPPIAWAELPTKEG